MEKRGCLGLERLLFGTDITTYAFPFLRFCGAVYEVGGDFWRCSALDDDTCGQRPCDTLPCMSHRKVQDGSSGIRQGIEKGAKGSSSSQGIIATGRLTYSAETGEKVQVALQSAEVGIRTGLEFGLDNSLLDQMQQGIRAVISQ